MANFNNCTMFDQYKLSRVANYGAWKFKMKNILIQEMLWHLISLDLKKAFVE